MKGLSPNKEMKNKLIASGIVFLVFVVDVNTSLGIAVAVLYILALFWLVRVKENLLYILSVFAIICTLLTIFVVWLNYPSPSEKAYINRGISILLIWMSAVLLYRFSSYREAKDEQIHFTQFTIEKSTDMILWITIDGRFIHANEAACKTMGYSLEEFLELTVPDTDPIHTFDSYKQAWLQIKTNGARLVEREFIHKSGKRIPVEIKSNYVNYSGTEYNCAFFRDITNRKRLEKEKKENQEKLLKAHLNLVEINKAYSRFVPHDFLNLLGYDNILDLKLGDSAQAKMSILFADIRDYSSLSEQMTPQENFEFINAYLGRIGPVIKENGGFINQYYGDGVMALFVENHENALKAAVQIQQVICKYNIKRRKVNRTTIEIGIGIHLGELMLGVIGDYERNDSGVISNAVNMASRFEGLTKLFGTSTIFSEQLKEDIPNITPYNTRHLGKFQVKGSTKPVNIFQTFEGTGNEKIYREASTLQLFATGLKYYYDLQFKKAKSCFEKVLIHNPSDMAADYYVHQSKEHLAANSEADWQGVEVMITK